MNFPQVSVSHEVSPLIKLVGRGDTTVVDAYLSPILRRYVATSPRFETAATALALPRGGGRRRAAEVGMHRNLPTRAGEGAAAASGEARPSA